MVLLGPSCASVEDRFLFFVVSAMLALLIATHDHMELELQKLFTSAPKKETAIA